MYAEENLSTVIDAFAHSDHCLCAECQSAHRPLSRRQFLGWALAASGLLLPESVFAASSRPSDRKKTKTEAAPHRASPGKAAAKPPGKKPPAPLPPPPPKKLELLSMEKSGRGDKGKRPVASNPRAGKTGPRATPVLAKRSSRDKRLFMSNPHTGETFHLVYWTPSDGYIKSSLQQASRFFRDFRANRVKSVDPRLLDILCHIQRQVGGRPIQLLSGYRTKRTNRLVGSTAEQSMHLVAKAADIAVQGYSGRQLAAMARRMRAGGIGTGRTFAHIDSGGVREWHY